MNAAYLKTHTDRGASHYDDSDTSSDSSVSWDDYHASEVSARIPDQEKDEHEIEPLKYRHRDGKSTSIQFLENIGSKLAKSITSNYCFICRKMAYGHYLAAPHRRNVAAWITHKLKGEQVPINRIFCESCNLAFTQSDLVDAHYTSEYHLRKANYYCYVCQKNIVHLTMHLRSKQHNLNLKDRHLDFADERLPSPPSEKDIANVSKPAVPEGVITPNIPTQLLHHHDIASVLKKEWTAQYCQLCDRSALKFPDHFKTKNHISNVTKWIRRNSAKHQFHQTNIEYLYCDGCNEVFVDSDAAILHYNSLEHSRKTENYCKICHKHVQDINQHVLTNRHITKYSGLSIRNSDNVESDDENEENALAQEFSNPLVNKLLSDKRTTSAMYESVVQIAKKLESMLTATYCGICEQYVNMLMLVHHYLEKEHTLRIRKWLDEEQKKAEIKIDATRHLYCEACFLNLCGTVKALDHYRNATHLYNERTYCSKCIFRGSPDDLIEHKSTHLNIDDKSDSTEEINVSLIKKLASLITLYECKLCCLKLSTAEEANCHYDSSIHNSNVQKWINQHYRIETEKRNNVFLRSFHERNIMEQLEKILDKMYFSKTVPFEAALIHLKNLNKDIAHIANANIDSRNFKSSASNQGLCLETCSNNNASNIVDSPNEPELSIKKTTWDYSRMKLTMELRRLKVVLKNQNRITTDLALQYVRSLNQLTDNSLSKREEIDFDQVFDLEIDCPTFAECNTQEALEVEIEKLENTLTNGKISVYVALDCITEFNIRLESFIDSQENDNSSLDFSDY